MNDLYYEYNYIISFFNLINESFCSEFCQIKTDLFIEKKGHNFLYIYWSKL